MKRVKKESVSSTLESEPVEGLLLWILLSYLATHGFPKERVLSRIAGGIADASIEIESDVEKDTWAIYGMLWLNLQPEDVVIGIQPSVTTFAIPSFDLIPQIILNHLDDIKNH